jgi:hypothetical protein
LLAGSHLTPAIVAGIVWLGALVPFGQVPALIEHFTGVSVDAEMVRRLTEAAGAAQVAHAAAAVAHIERDLPLPPAGPAVQLLSVDGAMVPLRGGDWTEVKTLAIGTVEVDPTDPAQIRTHELSYFSRLADAASFNRLATVETQLRGTETAQTVVAVVDGAEWCQGFIDHQRQDAVRILDFAHALGHLGEVAQVLFGAGTAEASTWLGQQAHDLRHGQEQALLARLAGLTADVSLPGEERKVVAATHTYLVLRREQICYQTFVAAGYPIGSGCVESANKLLVEVRLKGSGMHRERANVNPMRALRTTVCNGRWDETWPGIWQRLRVQAYEHSDRRPQARPAPRACPSQPVPPSSPAPSLQPIPRHRSHHHTKPLSMANPPLIIRGGAPHPFVQSGKAHPPVPGAPQRFGQGVTAPVVCGEPMSEASRRCACPAPSETLRWRRPWPPWRRGL